jgi:hypothetical protein
MDWQVTADARTCRDVDLDVLAQVGEELAVCNASVAGHGQDVGVTLTVSAAGDPGAALSAGLAVAAAALHRHGIEVEAWVAGEAATTAEADRRLAEPPLPEIVSAVEAAQILGVSRQRVHQLVAEHPGFPPPLVRLGAGPIWLAPTIRAFAASWERRPGRPPSNAIAS